MAYKLGFKAAIVTMLALHLAADIHPILKKKQYTVIKNHKAYAMSLSNFALYGFKFVFKYLKQKNQTSPVHHKLRTIS